MPALPLSLAWSSKLQILFLQVFISKESRTTSTVRDEMSLENSAEKSFY
jgi:hypothetical protein